MSRRAAITTSRKRVAAILAKESYRIAAEARNEGRAAGRRDALEELTDHLFVEEGPHFDRRELVLGERPVRPILVVHLSDRAPPTFESYSSSPYNFERTRTVTFRAIRKAWSDGRGNIINWFDWEPRT